MRLFLLTAIVTACLMEGWSAWVHRVIWHGPLWFIHRSHHRHRGLAGKQQHVVPTDAHGPSLAKIRKWLSSRLELNDTMVLLHAGLAIGLIPVSSRCEPGPLRSVGLGIAAGMAAFGCMYALVHDGIAHGRLPLLPRFLVRPFRRLVAAHRVHHVHGAGPYGFFLAPYFLRREIRRDRDLRSKKRPPAS